MIKNSKRRYVVILYIVLLTFFVSILYYGRIHHFGQISTGNETIIGLKPVNDKKKNEVKEDFRNTVSEEDDYVGPRNNRKTNSIIKINQNTKVQQILQIQQIQLIQLRILKYGLMIKLMII